MEGHINLHSEETHKFIMEHFMRKLVWTLKKTRFIKKRMSGTILSEKQTKKFNNTHNV